MSDLTVVLKENQIEKSEADVLITAFAPFFDQASKWKAEAEAINITSVDQVEDMKKCRQIRLLLQKVRTDSDKKRKSLKADSLRRGKAIDGMFNVIKFLIEPIEETLKENEDFIKNKEKEILDKLVEKREGELSKYEVDTTYQDLRHMPEENYSKLLESSKIAYETKIKEEKQAEKDRLVAEKKADDERKKLEEENARLKLESDKRKEANRLLQEKHDQEIQKELKKSQKLESDLREKEAEEKRKKDDDERKKLEEEAEEKRLEEEKLKAPDKEKLKNLELEITQIVLPDVDSEKAKKVVKGVNEMILKLSKYIRDNTINL